MALTWVCASSIAGLAAATNCALRRAQRVILLVVEGGGVEPLAGGGGEALRRLVDVLDGLVAAR